MAVKSPQIAWFNPRLAPCIHMFFIGFSCLNRSHVGHTTPEIDRLH